LKLSYFYQHPRTKLAPLVLIRGSTRNIIIDFPVTTGLRATLKKIQFEAFNRYIAVADRGLHIPGTLVCLAVSVRTSNRVHDS